MKNYKFKGDMNGHMEYGAGIFCPTQDEGYSTDGQESTFTAYRLTGWGAIEQLEIAHPWLHDVEWDGNSWITVCPNCNDDGPCTEWDAHYDADKYEIRVEETYDLADGWTPTAILDMVEGVSI